MIRHYMTRTALCALLFSSPLFPATDQSVTIDGTTYHKPQAPAMAQTPTGARVCYGVAAFMAVTGGLGFAYTQWKEDKAAEKYAEIVEWIDAQPIGSLKLHDFKRMNEAAKAYRKAKTWKKVALGVLGGAVVPAAVGAGIQWYNANKITGAYKQKHTAWQDAVRKNTARERLRRIREKQYILAQASESGVNSLRPRELKLLTRMMNRNDLSAQQRQELCRGIAQSHERGSVVWAEALAGGAHITSDDFEQALEDAGLASPQEREAARACRERALALVQPVGDDFDTFRQRDSERMAAYGAAKDRLAHVSQDDAAALARAQEQCDEAARAVLSRRVAFARRLEQQGRKNLVSNALVGGCPLTPARKKEWERLMRRAPEVVRPWAMHEITQEVARVNSTGELMVAAEVESRLADEAVMAGLIAQNKWSQALDQRKYTTFSSAELARMKSLVDRRLHAYAFQPRYHNFVVADHADKTAADCYQELANRAEQEVAAFEEEGENSPVAADLRVLQQFFESEKQRENGDINEAPGETVARRIRYARQIKNESLQSAVLLGGLIDRDRRAAGSQLLRNHHQQARDCLVDFVSQQGDPGLPGFDDLMQQERIEIDNGNGRSGFARSLLNRLDTEQNEFVKRRTHNWHDLAEVSELQDGGLFKRTMAARTEQFNQLLARICPEQERQVAAEVAAHEEVTHRDYRPVVNTEFYIDRADPLLRFLAGQTEDSGNVPVYMLKRDAEGRVLDAAGNPVVLADNEYILGNKVMKKKSWWQLGSDHVVREFQPVWVINQTIGAQGAPIAATVRSSLEQDVASRLREDARLRFMQKKYAERARRVFKLLTDWAADGTRITPTMRQELNTELDSMRGAHLYLSNAMADVFVEKPQNNEGIEPEKYQSLRHLAGLEHRMGVLAGHAEPLKLGIQSIAHRAQQKAEDDVRAFLERNNNKPEEERLKGRDLASKVKEVRSTGQMRGAKEERNRLFQQQAAAYNAALLEHQGSFGGQEIAPNVPVLGDGDFRHAQSNHRFNVIHELQQRARGLLPSVQEKTAFSSWKNYLAMQEAAPVQPGRIPQAPQPADYQADENPQAAYERGVADWRAELQQRQQEIAAYQQQFQQYCVDRQKMSKQHREASLHLSNLFRRMYRDVEKRCNQVPQAATRIQRLVRGRRAQRAAAAAAAEDGAQ